MRVQHTPHALETFPVYSSAFLSPTRLAIGGGGGASRSGVKNKIRVYDVSPDRSISLVDEFELGKDEDAPMSMAAHPETNTLICGVNSVEEQIEKGLNENCRVYMLKEDKLLPSKTARTLTNKDLEDYQRVTTLSLDGTLLAVAGTHDISLLSFPSLEPLAASLNIKDAEIYDAAFSPDTLVVATSANLLVYALPDASAQKPSTSPLVLQHKVPIPHYFDATQKSSYRAVRFHPHDSTVLFALLNTIPQRAQKSKVPARQAYMALISLKTGDVITMRKLADKGSTCFDISANGELLAYGTSDCTIGIMETKGLTMLVTVLKAHDFPPTTLRFNPTASLLVSGSADNSIRIMSVPSKWSRSVVSRGKLLAIAMIAVLLAYLFQHLFNELKLISTS
ncbi:WD40-repeat-containing domain protein [Pterulicium gracile]|uniref:WD40-repeat-containing domain protein n=1 Tax=Pterulicium gracile TaxID=1884261 RepID=A0A5C3QAL5_9AGAR|nr:WD40-repeat-containing domain protein [Pterula gracilis]